MAESCIIAESTSFLVSEGHVDLSGSALFPFVRYLSRAICYLLKQVLISVNLLSASCFDLRSDACKRAHMNVDHVMLGRGLSSINYVSLNSRRLHLNLKDLNLTVASPTAKPPNLIHCQYFRLYSICIHLCMFLCGTPWQTSRYHSCDCPG